MSIAIGLALSIAACGPTQPTLDETGIVMIGAGEQVQAVPGNEEMALAFSRASELAAANGNDVGYPWIDPSSGDLVVSAVTTRGRDVLTTTSFGVPYRIRDVMHGAAELERIQHDVTTLNAQGVPGADLIFASFPDHRDNRTAIVIRASSRQLLDALAARYDPTALAVRISATGL